MSPRPDAAMEIYVFGSGAVSACSGYPGYLVDGTVLLDCPPGAVKKLIRMGVSPVEITDVVLTHFHADHYFDLPFLLLARYKKTETPLRLHCPEEGRRIVPQLLALAYPDIPLETVPLVLDHQDRFEAAGYAVERLPMVHGVKEQCYGYVLEKGGLSVGFSGDTAPCSALKTMAGRCRHLVLECTLSAANAKHMGMDALLALHDAHPACRLYATHMTDGAREKLLALTCDGVQALEDDQRLQLQ